MLICAADITIDNDAYETINEYLKGKLDKCPKLDLEDLMESAYKWLHAGRKREHIKSLVKFRKQGKPPNDKVLERALQQFTGLRKNLKKLKCDSESQELRKANNDLVANYDSNNLVKKIVLHYDRRHSLACQREYPKTYDIKLENFDKIERKRIEIVLDQVVRGYLLIDDEKTNYIAMSKAAEDNTDLLEQLKKKNIRTQLYLKFVIGVQGMRPSSGSDPRLLYDGIKNLINTPYGKDLTLVHVQKTNQGNIHMPKEIAIGLFKSFLLEPCNSFVEHFSTDLFLPARYDAVRLLKQDNQVSQLPDASLSQFYLSWAEFRLCYSFLNDKNYRLEMAREIGEIAEQEAKDYARRG